MKSQALVASCFIFSAAKGCANSVTGFSSTATNTQLWPGDRLGNDLVGTVHWGTTQVLAYLHDLSDKA